MLRDSVWERNCLRDIASIISDLEAQKAVIEKALDALAEVSGSRSTAVPQKRRGRPAKSKGGAQSAMAAPENGKKQTRRLSAAGRQRLAESMKKRWAAKRAAKKAAAKQAGARRAAKTAAAPAA